MGLDAYVNCRCFKDGACALPPFPPDWLEDNGDFIHPDHDNPETRTAHATWAATACPHPDFVLLNLRVSNWPCFRALQDALAYAGWEHFPTLHTELPEVNGGVLEDSAQALQEIQRFRNLQRKEDAIELIDVATGRAVTDYLAAYDGEFCWGEHVLGVDPQGFFARPRDSQTVTFRSTHFTQQMESDFVTWRDLPSGQSYSCSTAVTRQEPRTEPNAPTSYRSVAPRELRLQTRSRSLSEYEHVLETLEQLFRASIATGNPVVWG